MKLRLLVLGFLVPLAGGCRDRAAPPSSHAAPAPTSARSAAAAPSLAVDTEFDNLDTAPPAAHDRLVSIAQAIEHDRKGAFLEAVSTGGFAVGSLALDAGQVETELAGRSVAELTQLSCTGGCRWHVANVAPTRMELVALDDHGALGALTLMHEDDGSWGVLSARRM